MAWIAAKPKPNNPNHFRKYNLGPKTFGHASDMARIKNDKAIRPTAARATDLFMTYNGKFANGTPLKMLYRTKAYSTETPSINNAVKYVGFIFDSDADFDSCFSFDFGSAVAFLAFIIYITLNGNIKPLFKAGIKKQNVGAH